MFNTLQNLNLKWWHAVLLTITATIFILSLTVSLPDGGVDNKTLQFLSSGAFFIALGSMANQSFQQGFYRSPLGDNGILEKDIFKLTFAGSILYLVGLYLLYRGIF